MCCNICVTGETLLGKVKNSYTELVKWSGAPTGLFEVQWTRTTVGGPNDLGGSVTAIYQSFLKAGLRFPLSKFVVEVLRIFQIFLHQITPEAIIRMGMFVWAVRSQGLEPSVKCFCNMHELLYETKATGKEQYHNNFGCCGFISRSNASYPVPTYRKRWLGA
jgi:hypothetical protein